MFQNNTPPSARSIDLSETTQWDNVGFLKISHHEIDVKWEATRGFQYDVPRKPNMPFSHN